MRNYCAPLGWPRRDPRRYRFAVPNEVWEYKLKAVEFVILSYLCYWHAHDRDGKKICAQAVADSLHLAVATVEKHLVFLLTLPPSAFLVYAYLLLIQDRRMHTCHPSYKTIAAATSVGGHRL